MAANKQDSTTTTQLGRLSSERLKKSSKCGITITQDQLTDLMKLRGKAMIEELNTNYGGVQGLCTALDVVPSQGSIKHCPDKC